jgi:hypothetical protein
VLTRGSLDPFSAIAGGKDFVSVLQELHNQIPIKLDIFHDEDLFLGFILTIYAWTCVRYIWNLSLPHTWYAGDTVVLLHIILVKQGR